MNQLVEAMKELQLNHDKAFVPYIMAGDGGLERLGEYLFFLESAGATAVEVGIPFSDPVADGPTIQLAGKRAIEHGVTLESVLTELEKTKGKLRVPIILMTYLNPILAYGIDKFVKEGKKAGVTACIIPDLPIEEEGILNEELETAEIELIRLVTLTTTHERLEMISSKGNGFLYCVTVKGITGTKQKFDTELSTFLGNVKSISKIPVLAGFGISDSEQAKELARYCDGVVVGSKIVELLHEDDLKGIDRFIRNFKEEAR